MIKCVVRRVAKLLIAGGSILMAGAVLTLLYHLAFWSDPAEWLEIARNSSLIALMMILVGIGVDCLGHGRGWWRWPTDGQVER